MSEPDTSLREYGASPQRNDVTPSLRPTRLVLSLLVTALSVFLAAAILPGFDVGTFWQALFVALAIGLLSAALSPVVAAVQLPFTVATSFLLLLALNAAILLIADQISEGAVVVDNFWWALLAALVISAISTALEVVAGTNDDDAFTIRVIQRIARRSGERVETSEPGILFLEIDGLAKPVLQRAMRDGNAATMARWLADDTHRFIEWETDLSSQTGASQAGILLGSNQDIPAFRWVEKESGRIMACSAPADCEEIERRHAGDGLLRDGGASRGNLLSGEADHVFLTVSRIEAEKGRNPGYRAFFANGHNVTRALVLFVWEVILEWVAALRAIRRDVQPRGHRGGLYPFMRAAMCVVVRDLIVFGVLSDLMKGRPAVYATFSSYDEVAHHSGLERADTLEALRKLDEQFGRIDRAIRYAPRPYRVVVLSDHGQTQGATFKQRNGYGLDDLVERSLESGTVQEVAGGDEQQSMVGHALGEATGKKPKKRSKKDVSGEEVVVLGSGNLGLIYLMEEPRRLTLEELEERHPRLIPALREHPHVGWILVRSGSRGPVVLGALGAHYLAEDRVEGEYPLEHFSPNAPQHLLRTDGFPHVGDIMVGSFY
ncbi:MAG: phage holin family protein, partial [Gaiellaceae bacterium]